MSLRVCELLVRLGSRRRGFFGVDEAALLFCVANFGGGFGGGQEGRPVGERRPRFKPAEGEDVPAGFGGDFVQLSPDLDRAGKQRALTRPVEISGK